MYRNATEFCALALRPATLLNLFVPQDSLLWSLRDFLHLGSYHPQKEIVFTSSSPIWIAFIYLFFSAFCLVAVAGISVLCGMEAAEVDALALSPLFGEDLAGFHQGWRCARRGLFAHGVSFLLFLC